MFEARRLKRERREAESWLARARTELLHRPNLFDPLEREAVEQRLQRLAVTIAAGPAEGLADELAQCKDAFDERLGAPGRGPIREYVELIVVALTLALLVRAFVVQAFKIPSGSMIPTLLVGDHILVNKFIYGVAIPFTNIRLPVSRPRRGDIVVFKFPEDQTKDYIKRVIGVPGDRIDVRGDELLVNGTPLPKQPDGEFRFEDPKGFDHVSELYDESLDGRRHLVLYDKTSLRPGEVSRTVPPDSYFCMGDNRDHSNDSRYWGFVPAKLLKGKALLIYFSWPPGQWFRIGSVLR